MKTELLIPFSLITQAVEGDVGALQTIVLFYERYVVKLAQKISKDKEGIPRMQEDNEMKSLLDTKLILSILKFKLP